jgi:hypothetical protein
VVNVATSEEYLICKVSEKQLGRLDFSKCQDLTTEACHVSKSTNSDIYKEAKSVNNRIQGCCFCHPENTNVPKQSVCRMLFEYYDKAEFPIVKKVTLSLREKKLHIEVQFVFYSLIFMK